MTKASFSPVRRQSFRRYFQPSRIVLGLFYDEDARRVNAITLCFNMYCSYKPPMMAFAVWRGSRTHSLLERATECVLSVPGERLADAALLCGIKSGRSVDKIKSCGLSLSPSRHISVPGIENSIGNIEMKLVQKIRTGDHMTVVGRVLAFGVDEAKAERCLVSVGPEHSGYRVLAHRGIHRIGVVEDTGVFPSSCFTG